MGSSPTRENEIFNILIFFALMSRQGAALSSSIQYAMPVENRERSGLKTRLSLTTMLHAGYSVKEKKNVNVKML